MNREIKFRAWDLDRKSMITDAVRLEQNIIFHRANLEYAKNVVWMQYIGAKDRNGNDIYEGDIISFLDCETISTENGQQWEEIVSEGVIKWDDENAGFYITDNMGLSFNEIEWNESEVIGNIFQNPELLSND